MSEYQFSVTIITDDPVYKNWVKDYVKEAIECWGGQYRPGSPFFPGKIKVKVTGRKTSPHSQA